MIDKDLSKSQAEKSVVADLFDVVFRGEIIEGSSLEKVKQRVAESFNLDSSAAEQLFSGTPVRLKRGVDMITAERILKRLSDAGAVAIIVPNSTEPESAQQNPLSLAPLGSDVTDSAEKGGARQYFLLRWITSVSSLLAPAWLKRLKYRRLKLPILIPQNSH